MLDQTSRDWNELDRIAEVEAAALRKARQYKSAFYKQPHSSSISREQAVWDECLEEHFLYCSFCGKLLKNEEEVSQDKKGEEPADLHDIDICNGCKFLAGLFTRMYRAHSS